MPKTIYGEYLAVSRGYVKYNNAIAKQFDRVAGPCYVFSRFRIASAIIDAMRWLCASFFDSGGTCQANPESALVRQVLRRRSFPQPRPRRGIG